MPKRLPTSGPAFRPFASLAHPVQDLDRKQSGSEGISPFSARREDVCITSEGRNGEVRWITGSARLVRPLCWLPGVRAGNRRERWVQRPSAFPDHRDRVLGSGQSSRTRPQTAVCLLGSPTQYARRYRNVLEHD